MLSNYIDSGKFQISLRDLKDRLHGVTDETEALGLLGNGPKHEFHLSANLCLRPRFGSNRILNTDNDYTSVQLLQALRVKGLYARGTVHGGSKHFPKHTTIGKNSASRGDYR
ncbi:LOW QUALITY PROTEIN: Transposase [Phytophthora megakarya]|uniref:Transposase n=1 Tax=Phytophthora megakarya TaxID=4795 RepID=A0A225W3A9_9STRA|nr:LOW QUALITY PROTEIN: Transposase [Phytophthora megakarya]